MKNYTEFQRVTKVLEDKLNFEDDINVSVFESNIRSMLTFCFDVIDTNLTTPRETLI